MAEETQRKLNEALRRAATDGLVAVVIACLQEGAEIDSVNDKRRTALMSAAYAGHLKVVEVLLEAGADKTLRDSINETAEDDARAKGHKDIETLLQDYVRVVKTPDEVIFQRPLGDRVLEEIFNFAVLERISLVRRHKHGPVEAIAYTSFENVNDQSQLREAFNEHVRRGGTADEARVFPHKLAKSKLTREG
jgi:hypothetical protein